MNLKICLLAAMLAVATGIQASDFVVDELCYNITDAEAKTVEVAKYDYTVDGEMVRPTKMDVVVPMTVVNPNDNQTYRVTALGDGAFTVYGLRGGWFDYTSIVLPEGLLEIKANAFSGQSKLTSLVIPGTVKSVKTKFAQMSGISELTFPASVKEMVTIESGRIQKLTIEGSPTITAGSRDYITGSVTNNIVYFIDNDTSYKNVEITLTSAVPPTLPEVTRIQYKAYSGRTTVHVPEGCSDAYNAAGWNQAEVLVEGTDHADVDGIRYYHDSHRAIGYDVVSELNGPLNIPQTVQIGGKTYPVEVLAVRMFEGEGESLIKNITAITLPEGLKRLEKNSLYSEVVSATEVTIPASVEYVGTYFLRGETLKKITFKGSPVLADNSVGSNYKLIHFMSQTPPAVGKYSFQSAHLMVVAPDIASIPVYRTTLSGHWGVEKGYELSVYGGLKEADNVYYSAMEDGNACAIYFDGTQTSVALSKTIQIGGAARALAKIQRGLFYYKNITEVIVPETVKTIGGNAFYKCSALTSLQLPLGVEEIGDYAFYECSALAIDVTLPGLNKLGDGAFQVSGIKSLNLTGAPLATIPEFAFGQCFNLASITLNEGLTEIGEMGFFNCSKIKELELPASLTTMGSSAFWNVGIKVVCHSAAPLTLPKSTTYSYQFKKCTVIVPVGSVAAYVAATDKGWDESNTYLTFAGLADGVEYRANDTEAWVTGVADDTVVADIKDYLSIDGSQMPVTRIDAAFSGKTQLQKVTVPAAVKALPENMFRDCTSLNAVTFASGSQLQTIGKCAFMSTAVAAIEIPEGVTELPDGVFKNCLSLTEITLPSNLVSVGGGCFYNCKALTTVNVYADNLTIADRAFYSCESLETINSANPLQLSSDISKLGMEFVGCKSLKAVRVAGGMIGSFAFDGCESLVSVGIAEGAKTIGEYAFDGCTSLKRILLPASLQEIKHETFRNVVFEEITCLAVTPPSIRDNTFTDYSAHLCVPAESMAAYAAATGWKEFSNIGDLTTSGVSAVANDGVSVAVCDGRICVDGVGETEMIKVYSTGGMLVGMGLNRQVEVPSPGIYIVEFKKGTVKVAIR
jgi:hypothetical protein